MHQEHHIPWNLFAANFVWVYQNPQYTPRRTNLFQLNRPTQANELNHFTRAFAQSIRTFSDSERASYPSRSELISECTPSGQLFDDHFRDCHSEYLTSKNQLVENWIARAKSHHARYHGDETVGYSYGTSEGDLADVVKVLINENHLRPLLMLANHPQVPLADLNYLSWGHHFGFGRVSESALVMYLFINVIAASNLLDNGKYTESTNYASIVSLVTDTMDFDGQQAPHRAFFKDRGVGSPPIIHDDLPRLREYLKTLFRLLYRYDMVLRECGKDPRWEEDITFWITYLWNVKTESEYIPAEDRYVTRCA
jgi:hypothetical protein